MKKILTYTLLFALVLQIFTPVTYAAKKDTPVPQKKEQVIDWSQVNWDQQVVTQKDKDAYFQEIEDLEDQKQYTQAKKLRPKASQLSDEATMQYYQIPQAVQKEVRQYKNEKEKLKKNKFLLKSQKQGEEKIKKDLQKRLKKLKAEESTLNQFQGEKEELPFINIQDLQQNQKGKKKEQLTPVPVNISHEKISVKELKQTPERKKEMQKRLDEYKEKKRNKNTKKVSFMNWFIPSSYAFDEKIIDSYEGIELHPIENLLYYISQNQNTDGSFGIVDQYTTTFNIVERLKDFNLTDNSQYVNAQNYLQNTTPVNTRELAFNIQVLNDASISYQTQLSELVSYQNLDGGFALQKGLSSDVITTLNAISILALLGVNTPKVENGLLYVLNNIEVNGSMYGDTDADANYTLMAQTAVAFQLFKNTTVNYQGSPVTIQNKIDDILNYIAAQYNTQTQEFLGLTQLEEKLAILRAFKLFNIQQEIQKVLFNQIKDSQAVNGNYNSWKGNVLALHAMTQPDLVVLQTQIDQSINGENSSFAFMVLNDGYEPLNDTSLIAFADGYQVIDLTLLTSLNNLSLAPGVATVTGFIFTNTQKFIGNTDFTFFFQTINDFDYQSNWSNIDTVFQSGTENLPAIPVMSTVKKHTFDGIPAISLTWSQKTDVNRKNYAVVYRKQGDVNWIINSIIGLNNASGVLLGGFTEGETYEMTMGVVDALGQVRYYANNFTTLTLSADDSLYLSSVEGNVNTTEGFSANLAVQSFSGSTTTDANGNFSLSNVQNGSSAIWVNQSEYEKLVTKFDLPKDGTTQDVQVYSYLKEDTQAPTISLFEVRNEEDFILKNQREVQVLIEGTDDVAIKEADIYLYDPVTQVWEYLGSQSMNGDQGVFDWYIDQGIDGSNYKLKAILSDYQENQSVEQEWGPFQIIDGTDPEGMVTVQGLENNQWLLGESKLIEWQLEVTNGLNRIEEVALEYGNGKEVIATMVDTSLTSSTYAIPPNTNYASSSAYITVTVCDNNETCVDLFSPTFEVLDASPSLQAPWQEPIRQDELSSSWGMERVLDAVFENADGSMDVIYRENEGHAWETSGEYRRIVKRSKVNGTWQTPVVLDQYWYKQGQNTDISFYDIQAQQDSTGKIQAMYQKANNGNLDDRDIWYLQVSGSSVSGKAQLSPDGNIGFREPKIFINAYNDIFATWKGGYSYVSDSGTTTLRLKRKTLSWQAEEQITDTAVSSYGFTLNNGLPSILYYSDGQLYAREKLVTGWQSPIAIDAQYGNTTDNIDLYIKDDGTYDAILEAADGTWDNLYYFNYSIDTSNILSVNDYKPLIFKDDAEYISQFKTLKKSSGVYYMSYVKHDKDGNFRVYSGMFNGNEMYYHTATSKLLMSVDSTTLGVTAQGDMYKVYFTGFESGIYYVYINNADFSSYADYQPNVVSPVNMSDDGLAPVLEWDFHNPNITGYDLYFGYSPLDLEKIEENYQSTNYALFNLVDGVTYYWKVEAQNNGVSIYSNVWSFTSYGINESPILEILSPVGEVNSYKAKLDFTWEDSDPDSNADITFYRQGGPEVLKQEIFTTKENDINTFTWDMKYLEEGVYKITAKIDDSVNNPIIVDSGLTVIHSIERCSEPVTGSWTIKDTCIQDEAMLTPNQNVSIINNALVRIKKALGLEVQRGLNMRLERGSQLKIER